MIKGLFLDKNESKLKTVIIEDDLDVFYHMLECDTIDIVSRKFGDRYYDIVCDDEGLWKEPIVVTAVDPKGKPMLVGNLLIFNANNEEGCLESLTDEDIKHIKDKYFGTRLEFYKDRGLYHGCLKQIEY